MEPFCGKAYRQFEEHESQRVAAGPEVGDIMSGNVDRRNLFPVQMKDKFEFLIKVLVLKIDYQNRDQS